METSSRRQELAQVVERAAEQAETLHQLADLAECLRRMGPAAIETACSDELMQAIKKKSMHGFYPVD